MPQPSPAPDKPARSGQVRRMQHVCAAHTRPPRAIATGTHQRSPRLPPARSNLGRRNTPTPPKPARPFICRPFGATQCQARLRGDVLGSLGNMRPPDPPLSSRQLTAGSDPDPGQLKPPQIPGQPRMSSPARRWRQRPNHGRPEVIPPARRWLRSRVPGHSRMISPAGRWRRPRGPSGDEQRQAETQNFES